MTKQHYLLLLPSPPDPPSPHTIEVALRAPLEASLKLLKSRADSSKSPIILDIALPCHFGEESSSATATQIQYFEGVQLQIAIIYSFLEKLYLEGSISQDETSEVDTRILLCDYSSRPPSQGLRSMTHVKHTVDIMALARSRRSWSHVLVVGSEQGEEMYNQFRSGAGNHLSQKVGPNWKVHRLPGGIQMRVPCSRGYGEIPLTQERYFNTATFGTFDYLNFAEKLALTMTAFLVDSQPGSRSCITVGLSQGVQHWDARCQAIINFLSGILDFQPSSNHQYREPPSHDESARYVEFNPDLILVLVKIDTVDRLVATFTSPTAFIVSPGIGQGNRMSTWNQGHWIERFEVGRVDAKQFGD